jgi:hypothetical protein
MTVQLFKKCEQLKTVDRRSTMTGALNANQKRAARMEFEGASVKEIAATFGVTVQAVYKWREKPAWGQFIRREEHIAKQGARARFREVGDRAINALDEIANDASLDPRARVAAATPLLKAYISTSGLEAPKESNVNITTDGAESSLSELLGGLEARLAAIPATLALADSSPDGDCLPEGNNQEQPAEDAEEAETGDDDTDF